MEKSPLSKSTVETALTNATESECSLNPIEDHSNEEKDRKSRTLSVLYAVVMMAFSAFLLRHHSRNWKKWTAAVGGALCLLVRSSSSPSTREWFNIAIFMTSSSLCSSSIQEISQ